MKILLPLDFTRENLCQLSLLNFISTPQEVLILHVMPKHLSSTQQEELLQKMKNMTQLADNHIYTFHLLEEIKPIGNIITEFADQQRVDLLVVNVKNETKAEKLWFGTELLKILRQSNCPVLCLPDQKDYSFKKAAFFTDLTQESAMAAQKLEPIIQLFQLSVTWIKVVTPSNFQTSKKFKLQTQQIQSTFNPHWKEKPVLITDFSVEEGIQHYIQDEDVDLAMFATHGRTGLSLYYYGSVTENIIENLYVPAMVISLPK